MGVPTPRGKQPHEADLMVLRVHPSETGDVDDDQFTIDHSVEVETSAKDIDDYVDILVGYRDAKIPVLYLIHNTTLPGSDSRAGITRIYNRVRKAAAKAWGVRDDQVDDIVGFEARIAPDDWKTTDPTGRLRAAREAGVSPDA